MTGIQLPEVNDERRPIVLDRERERTARERGARYLFIPRPLAIVGRPEFANFPLNILFYGARLVDSKVESGQALYEPILESFEILGACSAMRYRNSYGAAGKVRIAFDPAARVWSGERYVRDELRDTWVGDEWRSFFVNFTAPGPLQGEPCLLKREGAPR